MQEVSRYTVFNIREYLNGQNDELGEDDLLQVLSEFSCEKNPDVAAKRKLARVSELNEQNHTYTLAAYLIAQLGKNFHNGANERITGEELLGLAIKQIQQLQYLAGGMVVFLETSNEEKLLSFYHDKGFQQFDSRLSETVGREPHELIQLLKILK